MYRIYYNRTTPLLAFLEGLVRVFDWGIFLEMRKRWRKKGTETPTPRDDEWTARIADWYIREAIATFETEEYGKLASDPLLPRRSFAVADIMLGSLGTKDVMLRYEQMVPGSTDRILQMASQRLENDGEAELELLDERIKQGYWGMAVGFILAMLCSGSATYLFLTGRSWAGLSAIGIQIMVMVCVTAYISKTKMRRNFYNRDFFSRKKRKR